MLFTMIIKDLKLLLHDRIELFVLLFMPLAFIGILGGMNMSAVLLTFLHYATICKKLGLSWTLKREQLTLNILTWH